MEKNYRSNRINGANYVLRRQQLEGDILQAQNDVIEWKTDYVALKDKVGFETKAMIGGIFVGIGLAMTIVSIQSICDRIVKMNDSYDAYKNREFTPIPTMIVDAEDIVTVVRGEDGSFDRKIEFDQYLYYEAVRCNRQEVGRIGRWQKGVEEYLKEGCGDVADLNADQGKEWLALYTVKSDSKGRGYPILADSLLLAYGEKNRPKAAVLSLHFFLEEGLLTLQIRDTASRTGRERLSLRGVLIRPYKAWNRKRYNLI